MKHHTIKMQAPEAAREYCRINRCDGLRISPIHHEALAALREAAK